MARFSFRSVVEEFEAHLLAADAASPAKGKAERKRYGNGEERLKLRASGLQVPDGTQAEFLLDGKPVATAPVHGGRVSRRVESPSSPVPAVGNGQVLELVVAGRVVLSGRFRQE